MLDGGRWPEALGSGLKAASYEVTASNPVRGPAFAAFAPSQARRFEIGGRLRMVL
jgi:hypothetical protein